MEGYRAELRIAAEEILTTVGKNVFASNNPAIVGVPKEWEQVAPDRHKEVIAKLHAASRNLADAYTALIRTARRKLGADISN